MIDQFICLLLSLTLSIFTIIYYILKYILIKKNLREKGSKVNYLKFFIIFLFFISFSLNSFVLYLNRNNKNLFYYVIMFSSILMLILSFRIFYSSYKLENYSIGMDYPSHWRNKGTIKLGKIFWKNKQKHSFYLHLEDLTQHMFITGLTGSGKSNFLQSFLLEFRKKHKDIPFLITEFKGEYHHLQTKIKDMLILKPGKNFSINIFDPEGSNPAIHAERVFKIFESGGLLENIDYSPQMQRIFIEILNSIIKEPKYRNWSSFEEVTKQYLNKTKDITFKNSIIAIQNRIRRYYIGPLKNIFDKDSGYSVRELFNHKILLDLNSIIKLGGEKEDALFFLNMILKYLWDRNIELGSKNYKGIRHITIIEDAQYYAPQDLLKRTKLTSYLEDIALLLRGTGECLISLATRPNISKEILNNAGVLICFQIHMQKEFMQELLNLEEYQVKYLSELKRGQCIVRVNSIEKPFLLQTSYIKRHWLTNKEIDFNNQKIIEEKNDEISKNIKIKREYNKKKEKKSVTIGKEVEKTEFMENKHKEIKKESYCMFCKSEIDINRGYCENCATLLEERDKEFKELKALVHTIRIQENEKKDIM